METSTDQNFVFGSDDDSYQESLQSQRIDKLNLKVTLLAILFPLVLIVILVLMYMDMKDKVVQVHNTGTTEVQQTAEDLKKLINDLKTAQIDFEKSVNDKTASLEKSTAPMEKRLGQHQKDIDYLSSIKADKKTLDAKSKAMKDSVDKIAKEVETLKNQNAKLVAIAQGLQERINEITALKAGFETQQTELSELKKEVATTRKEAASDQELASELKKQKAFYRLEINDLEEKIIKKIDALKQSIPAKAPSGNTGTQAQ